MPVASIISSRFQVLIFAGHPITTMTGCTSTSLHDEGAPETWFNVVQHQLSWPIIYRASHVLAA